MVTRNFSREIRTESYNLDFVPKIIQSQTRNLLRKSRKRIFSFVKKYRSLVKFSIFPWIAREIFKNYDKKKTTFSVLRRFRSSEEN